MSRYLVTGCAGFIGSHLTDALLEAGHEVVGVDSFTDYYPRGTKDRNLSVARDHDAFQLVELDLACEDPPGLDGIDGIFHLAAQPGVRVSWDSFELYTRNNLVVTQRLFAAAAQFELRVVFASSSSVYGDAEVYPTSEDAVPRPISPYGITKLGCERLAEIYRMSFNLDVVTLRYFSVYGPRQRPDMAFAQVMSAIIRAAPFSLFGSGRQSRDFTYVGDAVAATMAAFERGSPGAVFNVGGGEESSLRDVIGVIEGLAGRKLEIRYDDFGEGDARRTSADTTRITNELGWTPTTSLEAGLAKQLDFTTASGRASAGA